MPSPITLTLHHTEPKNEVFLKATVCLETPTFLSLSGYATGSQELLIKTSIEESPNANKARMIKSL